MDERKNNSEVARVMEQIRQEYEAAHRLMYDRSDKTAIYRFIHARMENVLNRSHERLTELVGGMREGTNALAEALQQIGDRQPASVTSPELELAEPGTEVSHVR